MEQKIGKIDESIKVQQEKYGESLRYKIQLDGIMKEKQALEVQLKKSKKELDAISKQAKDREKLKKTNFDEKENMANLGREIEEIEEKKNEYEEFRLQKLNEEDQAIIDDIYASEFDKEAARERIDSRNEELLKLKERDNSSLSIRERVIQIFKKYGFTLTAVVIAAGVTIGSIISTITGAIKKLGTDIAKGFKNIGAKAASAIPGLLGAVASLLFKAAGSAIGFLAEHAWLLILTVVAFLFQKMTNARR